LLVAGVPTKAHSCSVWFDLICGYNINIQNSAGFSNMANKQGYDLYVESILFSTLVRCFGFKSCMAIQTGVLICTNRIETLKLPVNAID
jgi:hypothetical protein